MVRDDHQEITKRSAQRQATIVYTLRGSAQADEPLAPEGQRSAAQMSQAVVPRDAVAELATSFLRVSFPFGLGWLTSETMAFCSGAKGGGSEDHHAQGTDRN